MGQECAKKEEWIDLPEIPDSIFIDGEEQDND
jgi:hypothetical protein